MEHSKRYSAIYRVGRIFTTFYMKLKYGYRTNKPEAAEGPYIVMANHTTEEDMFMLGAAFKKPMYIVVGEHLTRSKHGKLIFKYLQPIPIFKGSVAAAPVREIMRRIKDGYNIMIFPEGSRSFNGVTEPVEVSSGKMVKACRCGLYTYRTKGGYFMAPRWGKYFRNGHCEGEVVHYYSPEALSKMSAEEITAHINEDIYENAHETQRQWMKPYRGKNLAEGIENYCIICPECGAYDALKSEGNRFYCGSCGLKGEYLETGFFSGEKLPFDNVLDWGRWQEKRFDEDLAKKPEQELLFQEDDVTLYEVSEDHVQTTIGTGTLLAYKDHLEMLGNRWDFSAIPTMSMLYYGKTLLFMDGKRHLGITGEHFHAWKENRLYENFKKSEVSVEK